MLRRRVRPAAAKALSPLWTSSPVSSVNIVAPAAQRSVCPSTLLARRAPARAPCTPASPSSRRSASPASRRRLVVQPRDPEVEDLDRAVVVRNRFAGLRSRWMMPLACAAASTSRSCVADRHDEPRPAGARRQRSRRSSSGAPSSSSMTTNADPSSAMSSSSTATAPGCSTEFATYPSRRKRVADLLAHRELGVEHLDGEALLVPVRGRVDDRHPADAEHAVEAVLAAEHMPEARFGNLFQLVVGHGVRQSYLRRGTVTHAHARHSNGRRAGQRRSRGGRALVETPRLTLTLLSPEAFFMRRLLLLCCRHEPPRLSALLACVSDDNNPRSSPTATPPSMAPPSGADGGSARTSPTAAPATPAPTPTPPPSTTPTRATLARRRLAHLRRRRHGPLPPRPRQSQANPVSAVVHGGFLCGRDEGRPGRTSQRIPRAEARELSPRGKRMPSSRRREHQHLLGRNQ